MSMLIAFVAAAVAPDDVAVAMVELAIFIVEVPISMSKRKLQGSKLSVDFERRGGSRDPVTFEFEVDFFCNKSIKGIKRYCYRDQEVLIS
jgi:hypothetical protein